MSSAATPPTFSAWVNLASDACGTFVLFATDDYFASADNLVRPDSPVWKEDVYTDRGKWMDGWESRRRREPGHDFAIIRLGMPGRIAGILCDTTYFRGNAPQAVSIEVIEAPYTATAEELNHLPVCTSAEEVATRGGQAWLEVLTRRDVLPHHPNELMLDALTGRVTHVRLRIFPDGGVARLRVYGEVVPPPRTFWQPGSVDLAAVENGGTVVAMSDAFFGPPSNLLMPGRGVNMGDGWETKRRRTPGADWCAIRLGRRGIVERLEVDTHFFKGNAPQAVRVESLDATSLGAKATEVALHGGAGWAPLLETTPLVQHRRHVLEPARPTIATHLRVHMIPHGGMNRFRAFGHAVDTPEEREKLTSLGAMSDQDARTLMLSFNGSSAWADALVSARGELDGVRELFAAADARWWELGEDDYLEAFAAHPRIGASKAAATATAQSAAWSRGEQRGVEGAMGDVRDRLAALNDAYFAKFGFIFICFATGRTAAQMLEILEERIDRTRGEEIEAAAREQCRITRLRIEKWLSSRL